MASSTSPLLQLARTRAQARLLSGVTSSSTSMSPNSISPYFSSSAPPRTGATPSRNRSSSSPTLSSSSSENRRNKTPHVTLEYEIPSTNVTTKRRRVIKKDSSVSSSVKDMGEMEETDTKNNYNVKLEGTEMQTKSTKGKGPLHWEEHLELIQEMRKEKGAPVDEMGCEATPDAEAEGPVYRYQVLLSALLSAQTRDQITNAAMKRLISHGCTIDNILKTSEKRIGELIYPVGFWQRKAGYVLQVSQILKDKHNSDVPNNLKDLIALPGIGPKMAHLTLSVAWNNTVGICVDTHVHRIAARLGWTKLKPNALPEDTRKSLEEWLPRSWWRDINPLLVGFGQTICQPVAPRCSQCLCNQICPASSVTKKKTKTTTPSNLVG